MYPPRLMDFFGFERDFESFLARLFTAAHTRWYSGHGRDDPRPRPLFAQRRTRLMICLNAFQTTKNVFNDVVVIASLHVYTYMYTLLGHDVGRTSLWGCIRQEKRKRASTVRTPYVVQYTKNDHQ